MEATNNPKDIKRLKTTIKHAIHSSPWGTFALKSSVFYPITAFDRSLMEILICNQLGCSGHCNVLVVMSHELVFLVCQCLPALYLDDIGCLAGVWFPFRRKGPILLKKTSTSLFSGGTKQFVFLCRLANCVISCKIYSILVYSEV